MELKKAIKLGFKKINGVWKKPIKRIYKNKVYDMWQAYLLKTCKVCKKDFLASHKKQIYCSRNCQPVSLEFGWRKGKKFPNERGGIGNRRIASNGYIEVYLPGHTLADHKGRVLEHRLIMYGKYRRKFRRDEFVHHLNGIKTDNRIENLQLIDRSKHNSVHKSEEIKLRKRDYLGRLI